MDRSSYEFFSCPGFSSDQNRGIASGDSPENIEDFLHLRALADDVGELMNQTRSMTEKIDLIGEASVVKGLSDLDLQHVHAQRLLEVIVCPDFHQVYSRGNIGCVGHEDNPGGRVFFLDGIIDLVRFGPCRTEVLDNNIKYRFMNTIQSRLGISCAGDFIASAGKCCHHTVVFRFVLLDNQNSWHLWLPV